MAGPEGPHLFRLSNGSMDIKSSVEIDLIYDEQPDSATNPFYISSSKFEPERRDTPVPRVVSNPRTPLQSVPEVEDTSAQPDQTPVASWNPQHVVNWLQTLRFDPGIIEKFFINDITGSILLELQADDLKELDIQSFGKRHELMASIRHLRDSISTTSSDAPSVPSEPVSREPTPHSTMADVGSRSCNATPITGDDGATSPEAADPQQRQEQRHRRQKVIGPSDSVSIVGIEQVFPKLHRCSKGEECRKWQKQYAKLTRLSRDLPVDSVGSPMVVHGDPGNASTAPNLSKGPKSDATPSIVASSDALGPNQSTELPLSEEKLHEVEPRDPQENVRNFLNFQRLSRLQPANDPATPPRENFPSPEADSPGKLGENLRTLPKLRIPSSHGPSSRSAGFSANLSGQRTITPSMVRKKTSFHQANHQNPPTPYANAGLFSPSDYYRQDPHYGLTSPMSEMDVDVPLTAIPVGPVERIFSQSVPPDMRFGSDGYAMADPIPRPVSTKVENHRRKISVNTSQPALSRLAEGRVMTPIETPEDLERTPRATHYRAPAFSPSGEMSNDVIHSGWMKKRKTNRLLRHEWNEHHFALRGTQLAMYTDEESAHRDSKALEHIDVDDYAVACSSLASSSKLTAAFKKTVLKRTDDTRGNTAFAFSLIPSPNGTTTGSDRKSIFTHGNKSHHFAVTSRDERIDWMRELMLAKALRRGRESGASLNVNGNAV